MVLTIAVPFSLSVLHQKFGVVASSDHGSVCYVIQLIPTLKRLTSKVVSVLIDLTLSDAFFDVR